MLHGTQVLVWAASLGVVLAGPGRSGPWLGAAANVQHDQICPSVGIAILGAGLAGITAAQALANQSITDFVIVEYNDRIGGRLHSSTFGYNSETGAPYTIELGANWVEGTSSDTGLANPIWSLARKWGLATHSSNYSNIRTYNESGAVDFRHLLTEYAAKYEILAARAGEIMVRNRPDQSTRTGLNLVGWKPGSDMAAQAVEWWSWDWEVAQSPELSSLAFGIAARNMSFVQFSNDNQFVKDQRGYRHFLAQEASTFLEDGDPRLRLSTVVERISHSDDGVTIFNRDGTCLRAAYAICTFSLGVLKEDVVEFSPSLPTWKTTAIEAIQFGTYTKIFFQFPTQFWPSDTEFFLYADPDRRGYYPLWQSLSHSRFHVDSRIIFVTLVGAEAVRVEQQPEARTRAEALEVLRRMFPNVKVPEPVAFTFPRWSREPWARGSYSNWPVELSLEGHQNLRANVGRLWFAGEGTSAQYGGLLQGAWFEGREAGMRVAGLLTGECLLDEDRCGEHVRYRRLRGVTPFGRYNGRNGWPDLQEEAERNIRGNRQTVLG